MTEARIAGLLLSSHIARNTVLLTVAGQQALLFRSVIRRAKWLLIANAILIAVYLFIARSMWHEVEDIDIAISRGVFEGPLMLIAAMLDLVWLIAVIVKVARKPPAWRALMPVLLAVGAWVLAYALDRSQWGPPAS